MRLICPNCDAQYEVSDDAIPQGGRDVQCSNCGHAWFQLSPEAEADDAAEAALFDAPEDAAPAEKSTGARPEPAAPERAAPEPALPQASASPPLPPRRTLDESVLAVLREEAEHEVGARRAEAPRALETQPDLGLDAAPAAGAALAVVSPAARRIAQLKGIDLDVLPAARTRPAARRELLPDIEEINSSLRASSERRQGGAEAGPEPAEIAHRTGFRSGFVLMMIGAVVLALTYVMAPQIARQIPGSAPAMEAYVAAVDVARLWLDGMMRRAISALQGAGAAQG